MYERFTDRARKVMHLANEEAHRFNHEYIGTEHVLLGLIKEGSGVAAHVLKGMEVDLRIVRLEVEKIVQPGPKVVATGKLPQTPRTRRVVELAVEEARRLGHNYVGTEHLLLGLLREDEGLAAQVLLNLGVKLAVVRDKVLALVSGSLTTAPPATSQERAELPTTMERAFRVTNRLLDLFQALKMDSVAVGTLEHAAEVNEQMNSVLSIKAWLQRQLRTKPPDEPPDEHQHGIQEL